MVTYSFRWSPLLFNIHGFIFSLSMKLRFLSLHFFFRITCTLFPFLSYFSFLNVTLSVFLFFLREPHLSGCSQSSQHILHFWGGLSHDAIVSYQEIHLLNIPQRDVSLPLLWHQKLNGLKRGISSIDSVSNRQYF